MNRSYVLTDDAIRAALTPAPEMRAPIELGAAIRAAIATTPQRRPSVLASLLGPAARPARILALAVIVALLAIVGLLIAIGHRQPVPVQLSFDAPMFRGGPSRTGLMLGPGPAANPVIVWEESLSGPVSANSPAVVGGVVYVADAGGTVRALDAANGDQRWATILSTPANVSPAVAGGLVVVGDAGGDIVALDQGTGQQRWQVHTGDVVRSSPAIVDGTVYIGSQDSRLYALDLASGRQRWAFDAGGPISRSPAVDDGVVFVGAAGAFLSAIDTRTGSLKWQDHLGTGTIATPVARAGLVLATVGVDDAKAQHTLFALDAATGVERWHWDAPGGDQIYVGSLDGNVVTLNSHDDNIYALEMPAAGAPAGTGPTLRWTFKTGGPVGSSTEAAAGVVFISGGDRTLYAVIEKTGAQLWKLPVTGQPGAMAIVGNRAYVATDLGRVIAIGNR